LSIKSGVVQGEEAEERVTGARLPTYPFEEIKRGPFEPFTLRSILYNIRHQLWIASKLHEKSEVPGLIPFPPLASEVSRGILPDLAMAARLPRWGLPAGLCRYRIEGRRKTHTLRGERGYTGWSAPSLLRLPLSPANNPYF